MITDSEIREHAERHGVPELQINRDWAISHVRRALASMQQHPPIVFCGGNALCRTWCPDLRLSEDIDLLTMDFTDAVDTVPAHLRRLLRREFPELQWTAGPIRDRMVTAQVEAGQQTIKVQLVEPRMREIDIPTTEADVALRYSDVPATTRLTVPTPEGFAAMKLMAWHQRQAPRDLIDLAALSAVGAITATTLDLTEHVSGTRLGARVLDQKLPPAVSRLWNNQLTHQMQDPPSPQSCLTSLLTAARLADE